MALRVIKIGEILFRIPSVQSGKRVIANRIFEIQYRIAEILLAIWKSAIIPTATPDRIGATPDSGRRIPEG
jgi:hypothetical protein